jgi:predicted aspartyl protease
MASQVVSTHFPYLPIRLTVRAQTVAIEAFLDTGFDGDIVVPQGVLIDVGTPHNYVRWLLADGSPVQAPAYLGVVEVGSLGAFSAAVTILGDEPLVGRGLTDRFRVILDHGSEVIVEP